VCKQKKTLQKPTEQKKEKTKIHSTERKSERPGPGEKGPSGGEHVKESGSLKQLEENAE